MARKSNEVLASVGNTHFVLKDGEIVSVTREGTTLTAKDKKFQYLISCIFVIASTNHKKSLIDLLDKLNPKKGDCTYTAVMVLKQCELTVALDDAVDIALGRKPRKPASH